MYKPSCPDTAVALKEVDAVEAARLRSIWTYWEQGTVADELATEGVEGDGEDQQALVSDDAQDQSVPM